MNEALSSLKVMQRMERLATNVYKQQIRAFKGNDIGDKMQKAYENEKEHAQTLAKLITVLKGHPSQIGAFFGLAGGITGVFTLILSKKMLLKIDIFIEHKAVEDYIKFINTIKYPEDTAALLTRIVDDEKRHVATWTAATDNLKERTK
jgi:bacterioferritin